ncbi:MAG: hypothetical protein ACE5FN_08345 [Leptospirillia bacterium]
MRVVLVSLFLVAVTGLPGSRAHAADLQYSYLEVGSEVVTSTTPDGSGTGVRFAGSYSPSDGSYVFIHYTNVSLDKDAGGTELRDRFAIGVGSYSPLGEKSDLLFRASLERLDDQSRGESGPGVGIGVRRILFRNVEGSLLGTYRYTGGSGDRLIDARLVMPVRIPLPEQVSVPFPIPAVKGVLDSVLSFISSMISKDISVAAGYELADDGHTFRLVLRKAFQRLEQ